AGVEQMVSSALALARVTSEDPFIGLPAAEELGSLKGDLDLYHEDVYSLPNEERIEQARRTERAALEFDKRITNSEGGSFDAAAGRKALANSLGFVGEYQRSYCSISAVPIASLPGSAAMQRDYWYSVARTLRKLGSPEEVGRIAAQRTLRRLGARKVPTAKVPIVFDQLTASYLLNCYTARKLGLKTTGNAARGLAGTPGIGAGNFFLQPGAKAAQKIIGEIKDGLYVTEFLGFGVNLVTGDFSRGASGMWIRN